MIRYSFSCGSCSGGRHNFRRVPIGSTMMMMVMRHIKYNNKQLDRGKLTDVVSALAIIMAMC
jgi:hypothetical protein